MSTSVSLREAFSPTGLTLDNPGEITYEAWEELGHLLGTLAKATPWMIGDWWCLGEARFGETAAQAAASVGVNPQTILNYGSVARKIPPQDRVAAISWYAHSLLAPLPRPERNRWLKRAVKEGWDSTRLRAALLAEKALQPASKNGDHPDEKPDISPGEALTLMKADPVWREVASRALDHMALEPKTCPHCGAEL